MGITAKLEGEAGYMKFTLTRHRREEIWDLHIVDIGTDAPFYDPNNCSTTIEVSTERAAAIMALFVGIGEVEGANDGLKELLYELARPVFDDIPQNLRIIP